MLKSRTFDYLGLLSSLIAFLLFCYSFPTNFLYSAINISVGIVCLVLFFLSGRKPFDLQQVFYLANFVFLVLAARMEKSLNILYWGSSPSVLWNYDDMGLISLIAILSFFLTYQIGLKIKLPLNHFRLKNENVSLSGLSLISLSLISVFIIYQYNSWNIESVFFRGGAENSRQVTSQIYWLIYQMFIFPIPSICLVIYFLNGQRSLVTISVLLLLFLLGNPLTGMARWQAAMLYGAVCLTGLPFLFNKRLLFSLSLFFGLFLIFPLLDAFRRFSGQLSLRLNPDWLFHGHLDSAQSFARAIDIEFVTFGWQLLGAVLFFIPRGWWPEKPVGSGHEIAEILNLTLLNTSLHIFGEGYVNFGFFGVILFSIVIGIIFGMIDRRAWNTIERGYLLISAYPFLVGWVFFFVRGDLLSSFAYLMGTLASIFFVQKASFYFSRFRLFRGS